MVKLAICGTKPFFCCGRVSARVSTRHSVLSRKPKTDYGMPAERLRKTGVRNAPSEKQDGFQQKKIKLKVGQPGLNGKEPWRQADCTEADKRFRKRGTAVRTQSDQEPNRAPRNRRERRDEARERGSAVRQEPEGERQEERDEGNWERRARPKNSGLRQVRQVTQ